VARISYTYRDIYGSWQPVLRAFRDNATEKGVRHYASGMISVQVASWILCGS
jgi:hypothetical protein